MKSPLYQPLSLSAQTAYAELQDQLRISSLDVMRALPGSFNQQMVRGRPYVYYNFRDADGTGRRAYLGPASPEVDALIERHNQLKQDDRAEQIKKLAKAAEALGCMSTLTKHYRVINRLEQYGFFRAGGMLIGTHAFLAMGNMLGVQWHSGQRTQDVDFAHAGRNISIALGANIQLSVHDAITSLDMGLLPITEFSGKTGAQYRNPKDPELRLDFVTSEVRDGGPVVLAELGITLECLKFMEFSLEQPTQAVLISKEGALLANVPHPARYAVHKLIVYGQRPVSERVKATKDIEQAAALVQCLSDLGNADDLASAWDDACARGKGWRTRAEQGKAALLGRHPTLSLPF